MTLLPQVVDVPLIENRQCEQWHSRRGITVSFHPSEDVVSIYPPCDAQVRLYPEMLCAGYKAGGKVSTYR